MTGFRARHRFLAAGVIVGLAWCGTSSISPSASACTTFCLSRGGEVVFGRNYDFEIGDGMLVVNKRGVVKTSAIEAAAARISAIAPNRHASRGAQDRTHSVDASRHAKEGDSRAKPPAAAKDSARATGPARWTSKYGSITFNQYGREFPTGGMNEKGLVVDLMWLEGTRYPNPDDRPAVSVLEWIQYQLDSFATTAEVLGHAEDVRIQGRVPLHYLIADRTGAAATIEFQNGRLVVHSGKSLPVPVLTNDTYERSLAERDRRVGKGGDVMPGGPGSIERFIRAASLVETYARSSASPIVQDAFDVLARVAQGPYTQWSIVYDMPRLEIQFRTAGHEALRKVRLSAFDFACANPVKILDVNAALEGDVTERFSDYTAKANLDLVAGSYSRNSFLKTVPRSDVEAVAHHADAMTCVP